MRTVSAREANQTFSKLLQAVVEGEEEVITRRGKPVARLAPIEAPLAMLPRGGNQSDHRPFERGCRSRQPGVLDA